MSEKKPLYNQDLVGRMEEQKNRVIFLNQAFDKAYEELDTYFEKKFDEQDGEVIGKIVEAATNLTKNIETNSWLLAMRNAGLSDEVILQVWDIKTGADDERKERVENSKNKS